MRLFEDLAAWLRCYKWWASRPIAYITLSPEAYWTAKNEAFDAWKRQFLMPGGFDTDPDGSEYGTLRRMTRRGADCIYTVNIYGVPVYIGPDDQDAPVALHQARDPLIFGASA